MITMRKKPFNPNDFDTITTIEAIAPNFKQLFDINFKAVSLVETLRPLNYEIISPNYIDRAFSRIEEYYGFEVDKIV